MKLSEKEKQISERARKFIKENKLLLVEKFADLAIYPPQKNPVSFFTAGAFGSGKTEYSRQIKNKYPEIVLIDADKIRELCPEYDGKKAYVFNAAAFVGQEMLHDYVLEQSQTFVFDSSFSNLDKARDNINRSLQKDRLIEIYYVFQNPKVAWLFTQIRAKLYGRHINKNDFIDSFFGLRQVVDQIKNEYGDKIQLNLVRKSTSSDLTTVDLDSLDDAKLEELEKEVIMKETVPDVDSIDNGVSFNYSKDGLIKEL